MQTCYTIDAKCRITGVDGDWDAFALENDGADAVADKVIGHSLWDFVSGWDTCGFLNALFFWTRRRMEPYQTTYRCDSPLAPRMFRMTILPGPDSALTISSHELRAPGLIPRMVFVDQPNVAEARCSMCCRVQTAGTWAEPFAIPQVRFADTPHLICPECRFKMPDSNRQSMRPRPVSHAL